MPGILVVEDDENLNRGKMCIRDRSNSHQIQIDMVAI